jgi:hypothetical protein
MAIVRGHAPEMAEIARLAGEATGGWLREYPGYRGLLVLTDEEGERARVITLWDSPEAELAARPSRGAMRDTIARTAGMEVVGMELYSVPVLELVPDAS